MMILSLKKEQRNQKKQKASINKANQNHKNVSNVDEHLLKYINRDEEYLMQRGGIFNQRADVNLLSEHKNVTKNKTNRCN